jgi:general secretion pathway protein I
MKGTFTATHRALPAGFTLLEVLVALALLALVFAAALEAAARTTADTAYLRDRTFAMWVAANELTRATLLPDGPPQTVERGASRMGSRDWGWEMRVVETEDENVRRVEVSVAGEDDVQIARMTGYVLRRLEPVQARGEPGAAGTLPEPQPKDGPGGAPATRTSAGPSGPAGGRPIGALQRPAR